MKRVSSIVLEESVHEDAKVFATRTKRKLAELLGDAVVEYLERHKGEVPGFELRTSQALPQVPKVAAAPVEQAEEPVSEIMRPEEMQSLPSNWCVIHGEADCSKCRKAE